MLNVRSLTHLSKFIYTFDTIDARFSDMRRRYKASFALAQVRHSLCISLCGATTLGRYLDLSEVMAMPLGLDLDLLLLEQGQLSMPLPLMLPRSLQSLSGLCCCLVESIALKMLMMLVFSLLFSLLQGLQLLVLALRMCMALTIQLLSLLMCLVPREMEGMPGEMLPP